MDSPRWTTGSPELDGARCPVRNPGAWRETQAAAASPAPQEERWATRRLGWLAPAPGRAGLGLGRPIGEALGAAASSPPLGHRAAGRVAAAVPDFMMAAAAAPSNRHCPEQLPRGSWRARLTPLSGTRAVHDGGAEGRAIVTRRWRARAAGPSAGCAGSQRAAAQLGEPGEAAREDRPTASARPRTCPRSVAVLGCPYRPAGRGRTCSCADRRRGAADHRPGLN
jgi:hypothetical protein